MNQKYNVLFTDLHSNVHHHQIDELDMWLKQAQEVLDFWAIAYYPYYMRKEEGAMPVEDMYDMDIVQNDWQTIKKYFAAKKENGYPVFLGYEWQGAGLDGDHNIFFKDDGELINPMRYEDLCEQLGPDVLAIPHHLAYKLGHRGKNWQTHNAQRSPFAEIYSSHGSSESGYTDIHMNRHIHMGPRTGGTSVVDGLKAGHEVGIIASGDNHVVPGMYGHGYAAILATENSKEAIWDAFKKRRVYGVSHNKILLNYEVDQHVMGESFTTDKDVLTHEVDVIAGNDISRIELIKDGEVLETYAHNLSAAEMLPADTEHVTFKFKIEFGWGPDTRIFEDITSKIWEGKVQTEGEILSVEKCWTSANQKINTLTENMCDFTLESHKTSQTGKWMGPSPVTTEGFIFEMKAPIDSTVTFDIDGKTYEKTVRDILDNTDLFVQYDEAKALVKERFGLTDYYRSDPFYHNAYKVRLLKGSTEKSYKTYVTFDVKQDKGKSFYYVKVIQRDGAVAWSSPIWINRE